MYEKLKDFLTKDDPGDEELEMFLFAMNQQGGALRGVLDRLIDAIKEHARTVDAWIIPRLRSQEPMSDGLRNEVRVAMRTMEDLQLALEYEAEFAGMKSDEAYRKYDEADSVGHFRRQEKLASAGTPASED